MIVVAIVILFGLGYAVYVNYTKAPSVPAPAPATDYKTGDRVAFEGEQVACLPHRDRGGYQTTECAGIGIRTREGVLFGLSWKSFNPETDTPLGSGWFRVEGVFTEAASDSKYAVVGTIEIDSLTKI